LQWLSSVFRCFASVSDVCCKCFRCMLQMFYLDIAKVDLVLHMLQWDSPTVAAPTAIGASPSERRWSHAGEAEGLRSDGADDVWATWAPCGLRNVGAAEYRRRCSSGR
jgi:hypothetical protein